MIHKLCIIILLYIIVREVPGLIFLDFIVAKDGISESPHANVLLKCLEVNDCVLAPIRLYSAQPGGFATELTVNYALPSPFSSSSSPKDPLLVPSLPVLRPRCGNGSPSSTMTTPTSASSAAIPLTTVFTPPVSCSSVNWVSSDCLKSTCEGVYNIVQTTDTNCYPSGWATTATWFSPGLYCPTGYTINDTNVVTSGLDITETQARCCPSYGAAPKSCLQFAMGRTMLNRCFI